MEMSHSSLRRLDGQLQKKNNNKKNPKNKKKQQKIKQKIKINKANKQTNIGSSF